MKRTPETHPRKAEALRLLAEGVSAPEVARRLEVKPSTVRTWKARVKAATTPPAPTPGPPVEHGQDQPDEMPKPVSKRSDVEQLEHDLQQARQLARLWASSAHRARLDGKSLDVNRYMVAFGIANDKAASLEQRLAVARGIQAQISAEQSQVLARVVTAIVTDLGMDLHHSAVREIVRLRMLEGGRESVAVAGLTSGEVESRREELGEQVRAVHMSLFGAALRAEVRAEVEQELARRAPRQLPPGQPAHPDGVARREEAAMEAVRRAGLAPARTAVRVRGGGDEVVDGEVVSEGWSPRPGKRQRSWTVGYEGGYPKVRRDS